MAEKDPSGGQTTLGARTRVSLGIRHQIALLVGAVALAVGGYASYRDLKDDLRDCRTRLHRLERKAGIEEEERVTRPALAPATPQQLAAAPSSTTAYP
jgi:hypothetical protein